MPAQPAIAARQAPLLTVDGLTFKDLNKNGVLDPYEDWRLPVEARLADLIRRMTLEEKVGLLLYCSNHGDYTGPEGEVLDEPVGGSRPPREFTPRFAGHLPSPEPVSPAELVLKRHVRYFNNFGSRIKPLIEARWNNGVQQMAEGSRLGIPVIFGTDPRNANPNSGFAFWPPQLGLAATRDAGLVRELSRLANEQYRAIGIRFHIAPMADVATEPRWSRIPGTFGEDAHLAAELTAAYVEGMQAGRAVGPQSVIVSVKHFPGDGPVRDGLDPHNAYGKYQVYPGDNLAYHLIPFRAAFEAGAGAVMTDYAIPVGIDVTGAAFSQKLVAGLLRDEMGFDGVVVTDWGVTTGMPWGVEDRSLRERQRLIIASGHDLIGGENDPAVLLALVRAGEIAVSRVDESVRRVVRPMFQMGLFENPYVDAERVAETVGAPSYVAAGLSAQRRSLVLLKNAGPLLPLAAGARLYVEKLDPEVAGRYGAVVESPELADVAIIQVNAPYEVMPNQTFFIPIGPARGEGGGRGGRHEGTLAYQGADNAEELDAILRLARSGTPTVVVMHLDRPAVLSEFIDEAAAVLVHCGVSDEAIFDVLSGRQAPSGKLPFNLPRDMASVLRQRSDVAHDLEQPLFPFGFGLGYDAERPSGG